MARQSRPIGTVALVAGGGALAWLLLRVGGGFGLGGGGSGSGGTGGSAPVPPCRLRIDATAITLDGRPVTIDEAITACRAVGRAELTVTGDARAGAAADLLNRLRRAGVVVAMRGPGTRTEIGDA